MNTDPTRADAEALLFEFAESDALRKHGRAVDVAMSAYAGWYGVTDPAEGDRRSDRRTDEVTARGSAAGAEWLGVV